MRTRQTWQVSLTHPKTTTNSRAHLAQRPPPALLGGAYYLS
jgi:hypothetical protein